MIIALAGRRVDAADAKERRFPLENVGVVRSRVRSTLEAVKATALVCSAACGADLIALSLAGDLGIRRRVILPYARVRFRMTSVIDRPGDWGPVYDDVLDAVEAAGDVVVIQGVPDAEAYSAANSTILDEAVALSKGTRQPVSAVLVWDGVSRGDHDITEEFGTEARTRGLAVTEIPTT